MSINMKRLIGKIRSFRWILAAKAKPSFSQVGEDGILHYLFQSIGLNDPVYLEIGTNHPVIGNNTYAFYLRGSRGVLVEPDPALHAVINSYRPGDKLLKCGIALKESSEAPFYIFPGKYTGWNTFSPDEVAIRKVSGVEIEKEISVPLLNINTVIANNFSKAPDFIGIDVEGLDEEIIRSLNFERYAPKVICIETIRFGESKAWQKPASLIEFICSKGYIVYADTFINTIFCKKELIS